MMMARSDGPGNGDRGRMNAGALTTTFRERNKIVLYGSLSF